MQINFRNSILAKFVLAGFTVNKEIARRSWKSANAIFENPPISRTKMFNFNAIFSVIKLVTGEILSWSVIMNLSIRYVDE